MIDQLHKFTETYKNEENHKLKQVKNLKEELQRINLQIFEREKDID
jgi:hypothetical protein